jgi:Pyridoxamine 5'-phosphate oxidase
MEEEIRRKILTLLDQHRIMTVATLRPDGWPRATTVGYVSEGLTLYFLCGLDSQKAKNLARDNRIAAKAGPVPTHERLGADDRENLQDCRKPAIQLDKEPAIMVREPNATTRPAQDNQLMSKHRVLRFKPQLRLE